MISKHKNIRRNLFILLFYLINFLILIRIIRILDQDRGKQQQSPSHL